MLITRTSPVSGKTNTKALNISEEQWEKYNYGNILIQHAFPHLSDDDREFIMTGILPNEWDKIFGEKK